MLLTIPNVLTADVARTVRDRVNASRTLNVPLDMHQRGAAETGQTHDDGWLVRSIQAELTTALMDNAAFLSAALPHSLQEPRFERCCVGEVPGPHRRPLATTTGGPRGDLTATLFLTDPEEYDGGELEVEGSFGRLGFRLPAGHMVLFPTDSRHRTTPVTRGERVSCSFAVQSLVGDHSARETLYDLDRTVQALGAERGKGDVHVLRLAGIHYSLVRRWAEA